MKWLIGWYSCDELGDIGVNNMCLESHTKFRNSFLGWLWRTGPAETWYCFFSKLSQQKWERRGVKVYSVFLSRKNKLRWELRGRRTQMSLSLQGKHFGVVNMENPKESAHNHSQFSLLKPDDTPDKCHLFTKLCVQTVKLKVVSFIWLPLILEWLFYLRHLNRDNIRREQIITCHSNCWQKMDVIMAWVKLRYAGFKQEVTLLVLYSTQMQFLKKLVFWIPYEYTSPNCALVIDD